MTEPLRILIVDDHPIVRDGLTTLLESRAEVDLVGVAGDGAEAIRMAEELQPDVVVMDLHLPGISGVDATTRE